MQISYELNCPELVLEKSGLNSFQGEGGGHLLKVEGMDTRDDVRERQHRAELLSVNLLRSTL